MTIRRNHIQVAYPDIGAVAAVMRQRHLTSAATLGATQDSAAPKRRDRQTSDQSE
jgi:hypothetical protein